MVTGSHDLVMQVSPAADEDAGNLAKVTRRLRVELLDLDVEAVDPLPARVIPEGAKGVAAVAGWLAVHLGTEAVRAVLDKVAEWAARNDRVVKVTLGGDTLELSRATRQQQEEIINAWIARHPACP